MKLLIADDHALFRDAFLQFIRALRPQWTVTSCEHFDDAFECITHENDGFDLVLLDLKMPGMHGLDGLAKITEQFPGQKTAILSGIAEEHQIKKALTVGAVAYFPKTLPGKSLIQAIEHVSRGNKFIPLDTSGAHIMPSYYDDFTSSGTTKDNTPLLFAKNHALIQKLTRREREVLGYLAQGLSNKDIADNMGLQVATIKLHVGGICRKIGAANRTKAAIIAHQCGVSNPSNA